VIYFTFFPFFNYFPLFLPLLYLELKLFLPRCKLKLPYVVRILENILVYYNIVYVAFKVKIDSGLCWI